MFHTSQKKMLCFSCDQSWYLILDVTCWHLHSRLCSFPSCDAAFAAMPLQTKKCHYCRNANRCKRLSNSDLETTPSRVSTSPSRTGPEHFRPILSVLPLATAPKAPALPERRNLRPSSYESYKRLTLKKNTSSRNSLPLRIPATSYNKIGIAINSHLAGSDPSTAHLMDVPILTNFQSHGVRMFDEKSHLWKKCS